MKSNLQIASGVLSLLLLIEVSSYVAVYPPHFLRGMFGSLPAATALSGSQRTCVSTDPSLNITPAPQPPTPIVGGGNVQISAVAAGCTVPNLNSRPTFYVDATNGTDTGDGSQAHPWKNLQTVVDKDIATKSYVYPYYNTDGSIAHNGDIVALNPTAPIAPGSIIYLMNGNYGDISIGKHVNSDFIAIVAAPNQTPVVHSLTVHASSKWVFQGLKIQRLADSYNNAVNISTNASSGPVNDIIFDHNSVSSVDDTSGWSQADWAEKGVFRGIYTDDGALTGQSCMTITNNSIYNIRFGVALGIDKTLFSGNTINDFGDDGLDFAANDLVISHNVITNNHDVGDANHEDGMQGLIGRHTTYSNVLIDSNKVIRQTSSSLTFPTYLQGISAFDSNWANLTVINNIVITNVYHGLSFGSVHGGVIANNTVLNDGSAVNKPNGVDNGDTMIDINDKTHEGTSSNDVTVKDNLATELYIYTAGVTSVSHNIIEKKMSLFDKGAVAYYSKPGTYGDANVIDPSLNTYFAGFIPTNYQFNVQVSASTPASGLGATL